MLLLLELIFLPEFVSEQNPVSTNAFSRWLPSNPFFHLDTFLGFQPMTPQYFASFVCLHDSNQSKTQKIFLGFKFCFCLLFVVLNFDDDSNLIPISSYTCPFEPSIYWIRSGEGVCTLSSPYSILGLSVKDTNKFLNVNRDPKRSK